MGRVSGGRARAAPARDRVRSRRLRDVGPRPALLAAARRRRATGDPVPPDRLVPGAGRAAAAGPASPRLVAFDRPAAHAPAAHRGGRADRGQLGRLHLGREQRPRGGGRARLLHQPDPVGAARRDRAARAAGRGPVGRRRSGRGRRAGPRGRVRSPALGLADPGGQLRHVRVAQEADRLRRPGDAHGGVGGADPGRRRLPALAAGHRLPGLRLTTGSGSHSCWRPRGWSR